MDLIPAGTAAKQLEISRQTLCNWADKGIVCYYNHDGRTWFSRAYLNSLLQAKGSGRLSPDLARLHRLAWNYQHGNPAERTKIWQHINHLLSENQLMTARELAKRIGYSESCTHRWAAQGRLQTVYLGGYRLLLGAYAEDLIQKFGWLTKHEVARRMNVAKDTPLDWAQQGVLTAYQLPIRSPRFNPVEVELFARQRPPKSNNTLTTPQVAKYLGISQDNASILARRGILPCQVTGGRRYFPKPYVLGLARYAAGRAITAGLIRNYNQHLSSPP